jgi:PAS domain-containing protein
LLGRDITLERALRASLVESHERYKALVEMAADFAWECDDEGCFSFLSKDRVLGHAAIDLLGRAAGDLLAGAGGDPFCAGEPAVPVCCELRRASGDLVSVEITAMPFTDKDGRHMGTRGLCRSIVAESAA